MITMGIIRVKGIWSSILIANDLATHFAVVNSMYREGSGGTSRSTEPPTGSLWSCDIPEARRTVVVRVGHVQMGHSHPARGATLAGRRHVTVLHGGIACGGALYPVVS